MKPLQSHLNLNLKKHKKSALILALTRLPLQTWANAIVFNLISPFLKWERLDFVSSSILEVINCLMVSKDLWKPKGWDLTYYGASPPWSWHFWNFFVIKFPFSLSLLFKILLIIFLEIRFTEKRANRATDQHLDKTSCFGFIF